MHTQTTPPPTSHKRSLRRSLIALAATAISLGCVVWQSQAAHADAITVTTTIDEIESNAECSLREAVQAANTDSAVGGCVTGNGADTIIMPAGTFTLTLAGANEDAALTGDLDITDTLVISGAGASQTIIDANGIDRVIHSADGNYTVTLAGLTVQQGSATSGGGAYFQSNAWVTGTTFYSNTAINDGAGGASFAKASVVNRSVFDQNSGSGSGPGGGQFEGAAVLKDTVFENNVNPDQSIGVGGAMFFYTSTVSNSRFEGNSGAYAGGVRFLEYATIDNVSFISNTATNGTGGARFDKESVLSSSRFEDNLGTHTGGALFFEQATVTNTLFVSNTSTYGAGGALFSGEGTTLVDTQFIGNGSQDYYSNQCTGARAAVCLSDSASKAVGFNASFETAGGALFLNDAAIIRTTFVSNTSPTTGGAGFYGPATVVDSLFQSNSSLDVFNGPNSISSAGGAFFANVSSVTGSDFAENRANYLAGGATFLLTTTIENTTFHSNTAIWAIGGALFGGSASLTATQFTSNTAWYGVGGAFFGGLQTDIASTITLVDSRFIGNTTLDEGSPPGPVAANSILAAALSKRSATNDTENSWAGGAVSWWPTHLSRTEFAGNASKAVGGAVFLSSTVMVDSNFTGNASTGSGANQFLAKGGGATFFESATVSGTTFERNSAMTDGGGAYFAQTADITGSSFISNTTTENRGGGAWFGVTATVRSTVFERNTAKTGGGGAYFAQNADISGSSFVSNTATDGHGGGAFLTQAAVLNGVRLAGNSSPSAGGAHFGGDTLVTNTVFVNYTARNGDSGGAFFGGRSSTLTNASFEGNISGDTGGGAVFQYTSTVRSTQFISNRAWSDGGALFASGADLADTDFVSNTATFYGAGGANFESTASIANGRFAGNTTVRSGGGASFSAGARITNTIFLDNHATFDGGGVSINSGNLWWWMWGYARGNVHMVNSLFGGNSAGNNGAAIYVHDTGALHLLHVTIGSPGMQPNQAIAVHADTVYITNTIIASHTVGIERSAGVVHEDYTLFSDVATPRDGAIGGGAHSRIGNAAFVDPAAGNYHLTARSDAINGGVSSEADHDIDGQLRKQGHGRGSDIGFDEFWQWIQILTMVWKT